MKNLSLFNKLLYVINYIFAILLLLGYLIPFVKPSVFSNFSALSLLFPVLIFVNFLFLFYWLLQLKRNFFVSIFILGVGFFISSPLYKLASKNIKSTNEISIMNYNVRLFNAYNWFKEKDIPNLMKTFFKQENPDILCVQEYHPKGKEIINYPFEYIKTNSTSKKFGQAIFSKYKIINQGSLDFKNTQNNAIFVDIVKDRDTIRIYNLHIESLRLNPSKENFGEKSTEKLLTRLNKGFIKQQKQVEQILSHQKKCKFPVLLVGDFNNTAYSWTYKTLKGTFKDSYLEAGSGFGKTFEIKKIPMRIDFIFADKIFNINKHKNYKIKYSDHYPIMATISLD